MRSSTDAPAPGASDASAARYDAWYDTPRGAWIAVAGNVRLVHHDEAVAKGSIPVRR